MSPIKVSTHLRIIAIPALQIIPHSHGTKPIPAVNWHPYFQDFLKFLNFLLSITVFCFIKDFYAGCKMLMMTVTGRQAPSSWAAITALENIKLFRFKRFLLQGPAGPAPPWSWILVSDWSEILILASDWLLSGMNTSDTTSMIQQVPASVSSFYKTFKKPGI